MKQYSAIGQDKLCSSHSALEEIISGLKNTKNKEKLANEIRLCFNNYLEDGFFSFSTKLMDHLHGVPMRVRFHELFIKSGIAVKVRGHSPTRCCRYEFRLPGVEAKSTTYSSPASVAALQCNPKFLISVSISHSYLYPRHLAWTQYCEERGLQQNVDFGGDTTWGAVTIETIDSVVLPSEGSVPNLSRVSSIRLKGLNRRGAAKVVMRRYGRMYHALTNLSKDIRRRSKIDGEAVSEVDLHACFLCLLVSRMRESPEKRQMQKLLNEGYFYELFRDTFDAFVAGKISEGQPLSPNGRKWNLKVEFQRQVLFSKDQRHDERPLYLEFRRRFPQLSGIINQCRAQLGVREFACELQRAESRIVVDDLLPQLYDMGIKALGIHDGLLVKQSDALRVQELFEIVAHKHLGFLPRIATKHFDAVGQQVAA